MKISYLRLKNFMLYKDLYLEFEDKDIIGIIAEFLNAKKKSNRAGKSGLLEAFKYVLTGVTRATKETELIHFGADHMEVELGLVNRKGKKFVIRRGRTAKNEGLLECDWTDKRKEAQEEINKLIGCTPDEFELTNFFKQEDINKFMNLPPAEKKDYLMDWLKNSHWAKLCTTVAKDLSEKQKELAAAKNKVEALQGEFEDAEKIEQSISNVKKKIKKRNIKLSKLISKRDKLKSRIKDVTNLKDELEEIRGELSHINEVKEEVDLIEHKIDHTSRQIKELKKSKKNVKPVNYKKLIENKAICKGSIKRLKDMLATAKEHFCGTCPILGEGCDRIKNDPKKVKAWKKELAKYEEDLDGINLAIEYSEAADEVKESLKTAKNNLSQLESRLVQANAAVGRKSDLKVKYDEIKANLDRASDPKLKAEIKRLNDKICQLQTGLDDCNNSLGKYQSKLERLNKLQTKVDGLKVSISSLEVQVDDLKYLALMFGKNGIPSQEIENAFSEIADEINFVLDQLNTTMQVEFKADRELGTWEDECHSCGFRFPKGYRKVDCKQCGATRLKKRKDELNLSVLEDGVERNFTMESGGGKTFVSAAVRVALTRLKQRQSGSEFNVLFLDEIDSALDEDSREHVMKLITTTLIKKFGFQQVFWVSHSKTIAESVPHTLKVIRHKKHATAKWV